jgi:hypothetical protein
MVGDDGAAVSGMGGPAPAPQSRRGPGGLLAAFLVSALMFAFALAQFRGLCTTCATGLPPAVPLLGAAGWALVALLLRFGKLSLSASFAVLLLAGHGGLILWAGGRACTFCWAFLALEGLAAVMVADVLRREACWTARWMAAWFLVHASSGLAGTAMGVKVLWPVLPNRVIEGARSDLRGLTLHLVVRQGCPSCEAQARKLADAVSRGLEIRVVVVDVRSDWGQSLSQDHRLSHYPAFVAIRRGLVLAVQNGGDVEDLLDRLDLPIRR